MKFVLFAALPLLTSLTLHAQDFDDWLVRRQHVSGQLGLGVFSLLNEHRVLVEIDEGQSRPEQYAGTLNGGVVLSLNYDYRITKLLTVGPSVGYQRLRLDDIDLPGGPSGNASPLRMDFVNVGARLLFNYGASPRANLYSGLRVGAFIVRSNRSDVRSFESASDGSVTVEGEVGDRVSTQIAIVPIGVRVAAGSNLFLGAEVSLFTPHVVAATVGYRF